MLNGGLYGSVEDHKTKVLPVDYGKNEPEKTQVGGSHYAQFAIQPSEFIHRNKLGWCEGNAIKYICRHALKNGAEDLKKAIHYLQLLLKWQYGV
jgi:hypothetical protein